MTPKFFIGIDISKLTLDIALYSQYSVLLQTRVDNNKKAIKELLSRLKAEYNCTRANSFYCAEDMGLYATFLLKICQSMKLKICMESALRIKKSLGIQRGKNDAMDAARIAEYASKNHRMLTVWKPQRRIIEQLKELSALRKRLLKAKTILVLVKKEQAIYLPKMSYKKINGHSKLSVDAIISDIEILDDEIDSIIRNDERLSRLKELITSVPRVGRVVAHEMIIYTNEFKDITTARKFACYCGIAPFAWLSGTSIKGKPRVSHHANKELKALLHIASMGFVRSTNNSFLNKYYKRKVLEGKNKMSILNALRNKLVHRIYACIRDDKMFSEINDRDRSISSA